MRAAARTAGTVPETTEEELVRGCLRVIEALEPERVAFRPAVPRGADGVLELRGPWGEARYFAEAARRVTTENLGLLVQRLQAKARAADLPPLLMAGYVNPGLAARLREARVDFVDAAGNASLRHGALYVWITGRRPEARPERATRAFQATGLRLVALLLHHPEAAAWTYRALADAAGVSLGVVGDVLADLKAAGHLRAARDGTRALVRRRALLERWELGYVETLRPRLWRRTCRLAAGRALDGLPDAIRAQGLGDDVLIGGELGASLMTAHLRPTRATLHLTRGRAEPVMARLRLLPDAAGDVELLDVVPRRHDWQGARPEDAGLASPLLIHAELLRGQPDGRLRETAREVFEHHLAPLLDDASGKDPS